MEEIKISRTSHKRGLEKAYELLKRGEVIIIPTETVYGLAALANDKEAVEKVYSIKKRDKRKPLPLISNSIEGFQNWAKLDDNAVIVGQKHWPGPLTMIVKRDKRTSLTVSAGRDDVAVRIPNHYFILDLISRLKAPLVATSANISGQNDPASIDEISEEVKGKVPLAINSGTCLYEAPSTVINMTKEQMPILRAGPITGKEISNVLEVKTKK